MIQRPQTLALGLIILLMLAALFLPNWEKNSLDGQASALQNAFQLQLTRSGETTEYPRYHLAGLMVVVAGLAGFSISRFKNRITQMKVGFGISLSIALTLVAMMLGIKEGEGFFDTAKEGRFLAGFYCLFVALFINIVSNRLIRKDENLVRSMDRIR